MHILYFGVGVSFCLANNIYILIPIPTTIFTHPLGTDNFSVLFSLLENLTNYLEQLSS